MYLYLLNYNNYYNRQVKIGASLEDYLQYMCESPLPETNPISVSNFIPNDGISATQVINWSGDIPDYILAVDADPITHADVINSRWYVIESRRIRQGQYELSLYRDVIVDNWDVVGAAPIFVEKGFINDTSNPLLYNAENMSFNQIKQSYQLLWDETRTPWLVGYMAQNAIPERTEITFDYSNAPELDSATTITVPSLNNWEFEPYLDQELLTDNADIYVRIACGAGRSGAYDNRGIMNYHLPNGQNNSTWFSFDRIYGFDLGGFQYGLKSTLPEGLAINSDRPWVRAWEHMDGYGGNYLKNAIINHANQLGINYNTTLMARTQEIMALNGKYLYDSTTSNLYAITVATNTKVANSAEFLLTTDDLSTAIHNALPNGQLSLTDVNGNPLTLTYTKQAISNNSYQFICEGTTIELSLVLIRNYSSKIVIPAADTRIHLEDQPYDMFCMPLSGLRIALDSERNQFIRPMRDLTLRAMQKIQEKLTGEQIYDIQVLPYCPVRSLISKDTDGSFIYGNTSTSDIVDSEDAVIGKIFWASRSQFTFPIYNYISAERDPLSRKVKSQTEFYRLVSPNLSQYFDFNLQKNNGLQRIMVYGQYKPFNPWIRLCPYWNSDGLYSSSNQNYSAEGLILSGDFSLAQVSDRWASYELNNKNYMNIFTRQMESLDLSNRLGRVGDIASAITGTGQGVATGALLGGATGAIVGGITAAAGGIADVSINERLRAENVSLQRDNFAYQLGNIKALPNGLARTTALGPCNVMVPILEKWGTTSTEENIMRDFITYNGMTVMAIGTIGDYILNEPTYFKGKVIRLEGLIEEYHMANTIAQELARGIYIQGE